MPHVYLEHYWRIVRNIWRHYTICFVISEGRITFANYQHPHLCYPHLIVVVEFECSWDSESYAGGSIATGRATQAGQVKG
jgi:hypothetical protein